MEIFGWRSWPHCAWSVHYDLEPKWFPVGPSHNKCLFLIFRELRNHLFSEELKSFHSFAYNAWIVIFIFEEKGILKTVFTWLYCILKKSIDGNSIIFFHQSIHAIVIFSLTSLSHRFKFQLSFFVLICCLLTANHSLKNQMKFCCVGFMAKWEISWAKW